MPEEANEQKTYVVHTTGGANLTIPAHDYAIHEAENRIYFLDADNNAIEKWVVFWSGVAAIEIRERQRVVSKPLRG